MAEKPSETRQAADRGQSGQFELEAPLEQSAAVSTHASDSASQPASSQAPEHGSRAAAGRQQELWPPETLARLPFPCPPHGCKAICGARPHMEDAFTAVPFLLEVPLSGAPHPPELIPDRLAGQVRNSSGCLLENAAASQPNSACSLPNRSCRLPSTDQYSLAATHRAREPTTTGDNSLEMSALHFFGVFDGHGGADAALLCARTLHDRLAEALLPAPASHPPLEHSSTSHSSSCTAVSLQSGADKQLHVQPQHQSQSASVAARDAQGDDSLASSMDVDSHPHSSSSPILPQQIITVQNFEQAFADAFTKVDEEFGRSSDYEMTQVGSTAVVALVGRRQLFIGNCGDSRAVLCRAGISFPLTDDHKASREDEKKRIQDLGGEVMWWNGERVMGVLAVSRSIGDQYLRPYVIAGPEVTILRRSDEDELLLLASDGLWDVLSNQDACCLAKRCLERAQQKGASRQTAARVAAAVLTRAAVDKGSSDNITVVVVDLSPGNPVTRPKSESCGNGGGETGVPTSSAAQLSHPKQGPLQGGASSSISEPGGSTPLPCNTPPNSSAQSNASDGPSTTASASAPIRGQGCEFVSSPMEAAAALAVAAVDGTSASKLTTNVKDGHLDGHS